MDWQPIETAPKDGTPFLIWDVGQGFGGHQSVHMPDGALKDGENTYFRNDPRLMRYDDARYAIGYWRPWGGFGDRNHSNVTPTHWMPLPTPPVT